ncbi:Polyphenol oxidase, chloroplastic [Dichanthelium oligosanthes]|uniref:Polyphenol oxidase, chloroplastic n=1 Tax=Dichanthelium oligosanthes TaxID=888268 RepID=A0A1E5V3L3_9POAL|nr:Polyphenol oxidase, chloroplastic [Dichanthelium oligosanthes]
MESTNVPPTARPPPRMPCNLQTLGRRAPLHTNSHPAKPRPPYLSCKAKVTGDRAVDRRDVLLGLGGAAAAAGLATARRGAIAAPVQAPDLQSCQTPNIPATAADPSCCMTYRAGTEIIDFMPPPPSSPLRVRPAAHLVDKAYLAKYEKAVGLMRELPDDDPRSFVQQARAHCSYCNGAYDQVGFPDLDIQVHNSWLFFPWHRLYTYFHERILGKLMGDDKFALPFWNWDAPGGMTLPAIYTNKSSPLYDERRNPAHQPPSFLDLDFSDTDLNMARDQQIDQNLKFMYRQMISGAKKRELFMGMPYRAGDAPDPGAGSIENVPHGPLHGWVGDPRQPNGEDMGNFYSAARDPVFFALHSNIDRLWHVWRGLSPGNTDFADADWLDASFHFYDEEARLVRVRVRDCLDPAAMRYAYQDVGLPWLDAKPARTAGTPVPATGGALPAKLDKTVRVAVARPRVSRSQKEKAEEEEVLVVDGIQIADHSRYVKFDVYVNQCAAGGDSTAAAECAGSFALTPHVIGHKKKKKEGGSVIKTAARFGITDLLDEIGADGDRTIVVSLVPRCAGDVVTVGSVSVTYVE